MRKWKIGDKVVLTDGNRKLGEGVVKEEISSEDFTPSDLNQNGTETHFESVNEEIDARQFLIAITEFLGFDPDSVLCLPDCDGEFAPEDIR